MQRRWVLVVQLADWQRPTLDALVCLEDKILSWKPELLLFILLLI
jgi:hypothetical protein